MGSAILDRAMRQRLAWVAIAVVVAVVLVIGATRDGAPATAAERAQRLKETTLCPVCDGQNVLESNAPVAAAIRRHIDERVADGLDDDTIRADLAASYGDDVIAIPPSSGLGAVVWVAPVVGLAVGAAGVAVAVWRGRATAPVTISDDDRRRVARARSSQP